jgi:hypothetical protein
VKKFVMSDALGGNLDRGTAIRFRLPALLAVMTALALLAALAGPYFRRQSEVAQQTLAAFWTIMLVAACATLIWQWRRMMTPNRLMGTVRWRTTLVWRRPWLSLAVRIAAFAALVLLLASEAEHVVRQTDRFAGGLRSQWADIAVRGTIKGLMLGFFLLPILLKQSAFICERGVWSLRREVVWSKLKAWEWMPDRPGVLRLREAHSSRFRGDLFLAVPAKFRAAVEAFVREKTELTIPDLSIRQVVVDEADDGEGEAV